jgi:hypothetical protein
MSLHDYCAAYTYSLSLHVPSLFGSHFKLLLQAKAERKEARKLAKNKAANTITTTVTNADGSVTTTVTTAATAGAGAAAADADALDSGSDNDSKGGHNSASDTDSDSDNDSDDSDADNKEFIEKDTDQRDFQVHMNTHSICIYLRDTIILCKHHRVSDSCTGSIVTVTVMYSLLPWEYAQCLKVVSSLFSFRTAVFEIQ